MNLNHLRFANAVAATGSFTAAADVCCVTQPTLSNGISQLENEMGERLFVRTTRKVALTPFGAHILPYIKEVLSAQASLVHEAQSFLNPGKRMVRIGTSPLVSANLLSLVIEPFRLHNPNVEVVLREMNVLHLYQMLDDGLLDFVFGVATVHKASWITAFLYEEPLLFMPQGGSWQNEPPPPSVRLKDIAEETYVMVPDACGLARATRALFRSQRRKLREYSGEAMSYQVLEEWAALGIGAAILPKSKVASSRHISRPIVDNTNQKVMIGFEAVWSRDGIQLPHLLEFTEHLRKVVPGIVTGLDRGTKI